MKGPIDTTVLHVIPGDLCHVVFIFNVVALVGSGGYV